MKIVGLSLSDGNTRSTFSEMLGLIEDVWQKQEAEEAVLPFENSGEWEDIDVDGGHAHTTAMRETSM